jgi:hypothetical protein
VLVHAITVCLSKASTSNLDSGRMRRNFVVVSSCNYYQRCNDIYKCPRKFKALLMNPVILSTFGLHSLVSQPSVTILCFCSISETLKCSNLFPLLFFLLKLNFVPNMVCELSFVFVVSLKLWNAATYFHSFFFLLKLNFVPNMVCELVSSTVKN